MKKIQKELNTKLSRKKRIKEKIFKRKNIFYSMIMIK